MAQETVFSKLVAGEIPSNKIYEDDLVLAFHNIAPEAEVHALIIPKSNHLERLNDLNNDDVSLISHIILTIPKVAKLLNIHDSGYRIISNNGPDSGQEVPHLHFHIIGGETLGSFNK